MSSVDQTLPVPQSEETPQVSQPVEEPKGVVPQTVLVEEESAQTEAEPKEEVKEEKPVKEKRKSAIGAFLGKLGKKEAKAAPIAEEPKEIKAEENATSATEAEAEVAPEPTIETPAPVEADAEVTEEPVEAPQEEAKEEKKDEEVKKQDHVSIIEKLFSAFKPKGDKPVRQKSVKSRKEKKSTEAEVTNEKQAQPVPIVEVPVSTEAAPESPVQDNKPKKRFSARLFATSPKKEKTLPLPTEKPAEEIAEVAPAPTSQDAAPQLPEPTTETNLGDLESAKPTEQPIAVEASA